MNFSRTVFSPVEWPVRAGILLAGFCLAFTGLRSESIGRFESGRPGSSLGACLILESYPPREIPMQETLPLLRMDDFEDGNARGWKPNNPLSWRVGFEEKNRVYQLMSAGKQGRIRAPTSWSLLKGFDVSTFVFKGRARCKTDPSVDKRDICIFFDFQGPAHFYYVHFSASSDEVHNIIGLVNGKDRVKINSEPAGQSKALLKDLAFHVFMVRRDPGSGAIEAYLDDMQNPILTAVDKTLIHGLVGVGSFDDTGNFDDLELRGRLYPKKRRR